MSTKPSNSNREDRRKIGKALRQDVPIGSHGDWTPSADRPDPISLLQAQDTFRVQHLLPIKYGRMVASPFAFLRGSATVMAADLAGTPTSGISNDWRPAQWWLAGRTGFLKRNTGKQPRSWWVPTPGP
jgi:hypothetical protein